MNPDSLSATELLHYANLYYSNDPWVAALTHQLNTCVEELEDTAKQLEEAEERIRIFEGMENKHYEAIQSAIDTLWRDMESV